MVRNPLVVSLVVADDSDVIGVSPPMALSVNPPTQVLVNPLVLRALLVNPPIHGMEPDRRLVNLYSLRLLEPDLLSIYALLLQTIHRHQGGTTCRRSGRPVARLVVAFLEPDLEKIDHEPQFGDGPEE